MRGLLFTCLAGLLLCAAVGQARAQDSQDGTIAVPPAPPIFSVPPATPAPIMPDIVAPPPPPGLVQTPVPPVNADNADNGGAAAPPPAVAPPADSWVPGKTAKIGVLDKIDGTVSEVAIAAGGQATVGDLQVGVVTCLARPPGQIPDVAVFLSTQALPGAAAPDATAAPLYRGWMVRSAPGAAVVGDASETFRVIDCL